ncbi:hK97 family phage portal protein [Clostridium sp. CAG:510]|jgi:HK97 family phage portal protein|nr:hK97 family phage portal protein [Clostridium sp. CAG:510]
MGLFDKFFKKIKVKWSSFFGYQNTSAPFDKEAWYHDTFRATVDAIATHASKGQFKAVKLNQFGKVEKTFENDKMVRLLNIRPNNVMTATEFKYRMVAALETKTTAVAYIRWDGLQPEAVYPVDFTSYEFREITGGGIAIVVTDQEGQEHPFDLKDCVVIRKFYNDRLASGDGNDPIYKVLDMSKASDEGFINALTVANKIRGMVKNKKSMLDPVDVEKNQEQFAKRFENAAQNGGIISVDSMEDFKELNLTPWAANSTQMKEINNRIFSYLRTSEKIVQNTYTEQEGMAWYEGKIEPIWQMLAEAFTTAYFSKHEIECGNRLIISGGILMGSSIETRVRVLEATKETGELTTNERRELLGFAPVADGDDRQVSLNFVKAKDQSKYQKGEETDGNGAEEKVD